MESFLVQRVIHIARVVAHLLPFMPLVDLLAFKNVLLNVLPQQAVADLYRDRFRTHLVHDHISFNFTFARNPQIPDPRVPLFFEWVLRNNAQITYLAFIGPKDHLFSILFAQFLRDPRFPAQLSLHFLSIFCAEQLLPDLFDAIGDHCTHLLEADLAVTNLCAFTLFQLLPKLTFLRSLVIARTFVSQDIGLPIDVWDQFAASISPHLTSLVILESVSTQHFPPSPALFLAALLRRCPRLQHVDITLHSFVDYYLQPFSLQWNNLNICIDASSSPLLTYHVHSTKPLAVLPDHVSPAIMKRIYTGL